MFISNNKYPLYMKVSNLDCEILFILFLFCIFFKSESGVKNGAFRYFACKNYILIPNLTPVCKSNSHFIIQTAKRAQSIHDPQIKRWIPLLCTHFFYNE